MSAYAASVIGALFGALTTMVVILTLRIADIRERLGRLEEWVRLAERGPPTVMDELRKEADA